jgi:hypothetical protein
MRAEWDRSVGGDDQNWKQNRAIGKLEGRKYAGRFDEK